MTHNKRAAVLIFWILGVLAPLAANAASHPPTQSALDPYLQALMLQNKGDKAGALKEYQAALVKNPSSVYLLRQAADLALDVGAEAQARAWAQTAVAIDSSDAQSYLLLGRIEWSDGNKDKADAAFNKALDINPGSSDAAFSVAEITAAQSPDQAVGLLNKFLAKNPGQEAAIRYEMAKIEVMAGRLESARRDLESASSLDPEIDTLEGRYALAQAYEINMDTPEALAQYQDILSQVGPSAPLLDRIADLTLAQGDALGAEKNFTAAQAIAPADPEADDYLAAVAERQSDFAGAAAFIDSSAALGQDPALSLRLSYDLTQADRTAQAVKALKAAHARWPDNDEISYFLALGCRDLGQNASSEDLLRQVVKARPDFHDARYQLASLLETENKMDESEKEFDVLLSRDPNDAVSLNYLGYSLADRGLELPKAEALIRRAVQIDPNNGAYADSLGWAYFKENRSSDAVQQMLRAVSLIPDDQTIWGHVGDAYAAVKNWPQAWKAFMRSASLTLPQKPDIADARGAQEHISLAEMAQPYLQYLNAAQGGIKRVSGLCAVQGAILGQTFSFNGLLSFQAPGRLDLEWMGPLFTPLLILRFTPAGLSMSPEAPAIGGLQPAAIKSAAGSAMALLSGYLSGAIYATPGMSYKKSWFGGARLESPALTLSLGSDGLLVAALKSPLYPGVTLALRRFSFLNGRAMPQDFLFSGRGFKLDIALDQAHVQFAPLSAAALAP